MNRFFDFIGHKIAAFLQTPETGYEPFTPATPAALRATIKPGDVLLIEGHTRIAGIIKYLTQSTWSHAALYVGSHTEVRTVGDEACELIESNLDTGVICVPLSKYFHYHTRICRPIGLTAEDCEKVCTYASARIGLQYDLQNIMDLVRYLVPIPVPQRLRRRMIALGSGDPTRLICSVLLAQAFQSVSYPILPDIERIESKQARQDVFHIRDCSLYTPRDFDISPYFAVIKPTIEMGFDYKTIKWSESPLHI